jgi:hypothetical protein
MNPHSSAKLDPDPPQIDAYPNTGGPISESGSTNLNKSVSRSSKINRRKRRCIYEKLTLF